MYLEYIGAEVSSQKAPFNSRGKERILAEEVFCNSLVIDIHGNTSKIRCIQFIFATVNTVNAIDSPFSTSAKEPRQWRKNCMFSINGVSIRPRGNLPPPMIQSTYHSPLLSTGQRDENIWRVPERQFTRFAMKPTRLGVMPLGISKAKQSDVPCYDWIFSSASNVHVAIDASVFKTYTPFKSHVLTVSDNTQVKVRGVGTVDLKIRCQPGSKESHVITLENVLHVPKWMCNIFSDIYFEPISSYEHTWTDFGVSFLHKNDGQLSNWGFTEGFMGLERLVLARKLRGRSPMLEDLDREVFSVNLTWPQGQRDKWEAHLHAEEKKHKAREEMRLKREAVSGLTEMTAMTSPTKTAQIASYELKRERRKGLTDLSPNIGHRRAPSDRASSLKAQASRSRASSFTERFSSLA